MEPDDIQNMKDILTSINPSDVMAQKVIDELCAFVNSVENKIAELAIKHQVEAYIDGPYGASRWVSLEGDDYHHIEPGEWQSSAQSC